jgi:hypothetical protein
MALSAALASGFGVDLGKSRWTCFPAALLSPAALTAGASAELRGPLPPLSFTPLRGTALEAAAEHLLGTVRAAG